LSDEVSEWIRHGRFGLEVGNSSDSNAPLSTATLASTIPPEAAEANFTLCTTLNAATIDHTKCTAFQSIGEGKQGRHQPCQTCSIRGGTYTTICPLCGRPAAERAADTRGFRGAWFLLFLELVVWSYNRVFRHRSHGLLHQPLRSIVLCYEVAPESGYAAAASRFHRPRFVFGQSIFQRSFPAAAQKSFL
jgi:hypothetical protein